MKRFWLFAGECYYAKGGLNDFVDWFDSLEEALASFEKTDDEWYQVMDINCHQCVARSSCLPHGGRHVSCLPLIALPQEEWPL